jgi:hypothetical protein
MLRITKTVSVLVGLGHVTMPHLTCARYQFVPMHSRKSHGERGGLLASEHDVALFFVAAPHFKDSSAEELQSMRTAFGSRPPVETLLPADRQ